MKIAPVSADLLIKLTLVAVAVGVVIYGVRKVTGAAGEAAGKMWDTATDAAYSVAPWNNDNVIAATVNSGVQAVTGTDDTLGTWLHRTFSGDDERVREMLNPTPVNTGGATGSW
jgi:hypothetical protein